MKNLVSDSVNLLRQMVRIPSTSFAENEVCGMLMAYLDSKGLSPRRVRDNIICSNALYDEDLPTLVLDAHIDTVPATEGYSRDPFDPGDDESIVYGLGSNDDGGSVVSMIAAFRHFFNEKLPVNLVLALTCQEERSGSDGASFLYGPDAVAMTRDARWVIVGEPTGMKPATSERGLLVLDGKSHGVSGHAATGKGVNALYIALDDIDKLRNYKFERVSPQMGEVKLNVTQISCGSVHNVIPDCCNFVVDIRPTEQYGNEEILHLLQAQCRSTLKPRNLANRSSATPNGSRLMETVKVMGLETFSSATTSDWMRIGKEAMKMGPGDSSRSHRADEYILVSEIEEAVRKYIEFINVFCNGDIVE